MTDKQQLRALLRERRDAIPTQKKQELDREIVNKIVQSPLFKQATKIFLYAPVKGEINLLPLARAAQQSGKRIAFPRCDTSTEQMQFFELLPEKKLVAGAYNIPEPPADAPLCESDKHTLCILPALSCDTRGYRLGYGKGYYDKYLTAFRGTTVCAVYHGLLSPTLPSEAHDIPTQFICTEKGFLKPRTAPKSFGSGEKVKKNSGFENKSGGSSTESKQNSQASGETEETKPNRKSTSYFSDLLSRLRLSLRVRKSPQSEEKADARKVDHIPPILVLTVFALLLLSRLAEPLFTRENKLLGIIILQILIFIFPAMLYCKLRGDSFTEHIRFRPPSLGKLPFLLFTLIVMISGGLLMSILTGGISSLDGGFTLYTIFVAKLGGGIGSHVAVLLAYAILPAFAEELIFRSILCAEYEKYGVGVSVSVSAISFAMLHFSFPHFLTYLLLGAILALALYVTRSFFAVFLLHLLYNVFCLYGQPYLSAFYNTAGSSDIFIFCLTVLFLLFSAFGAGQARNIYHIYAKNNDDSSYTKPLPMRELAKTLLRALLSPATAICIVLWLVFSIVNLF